ncbi:Bax inhibitor-1/YccA family protein [Brachybacterium hainanense]|uniref:Bax inhibitor-1/YccA family protein n=1 Tax=Brachybacterium hainanense TaxID=1541174 RepID=A0ABV6RGS8_9MICO
MARHNVIFGRDKELQQSPFAQQAAYGQAGPQTWQPYQAPGTQAPQDDLESIYARPAATGHDTGRMTMKDALNAITATLGVVMVVGAFFTLLPPALGIITGTEAGAQIGLGISGIALAIGLIGGLVLGLVNAFKKQPSPVLVLLYAVFEGMLLGGLSSMLEFQYPGIALQAVLATLAVAGTVLVFFRLGVLRTSPRLTKIFMIAMVAYMIFGVVNIGFMIFAGYSLRSGLVGMVIGAIAVCMASYSLVMDFEDVQRAVGNVQRRYAWRCAFGIAATLVWMYLEILRLIAILRGSD